jgi:hypothetical protein
LPSTPSSPSTTVKDPQVLSQRDAQHAIKNGNLTFTTNPAVLSAPTTVTGGEAGCPNPNWTGVNPTLTVTSVTLDISQGGELLFHCTASNPNGLTGTFALSC